MPKYKYMALQIHLPEPQANLGQSDMIIHSALEPARDATARYTVFRCAAAR